MFVQRDETGKIIGRFANLQPGYAEEFLPNDDPALQPSAAELRAGAVGEVDRAFEIAAHALTGAYPPSERLSWPIQESETLAWSKDAAAPTPYVDALAAARGIARETLLAKIMENVTLFREASAVLIGKRQKHRDAIEAAADKEAIQTALEAAVADIEAVQRQLTT